MNGKSMKWLKTSKMCCKRCLDMLALCGSFWITKVIFKPAKLFSSVLAIVAAERLYQDIYSTTSTY